MLCSRLIQGSHLARAGLRSGLLSPASVLPATSFSTTIAKRSSGDHVRMWTAERAVSLAQIPACIIPFLYTTPLTDALFCTLAVLHSHWGIEAIVVDYIRPSLFNGSTVIPNIAVGLVWALSAFTLGALYYFNYTDVGIVNAIKMLWKL
ncbi:succinate dehydrogenase [ubiquinone] cytochrome b small subunit, mitochondrial isoform X1 [Eurytemora carolleeae]|uniref:succinate dehydrogenase [ubiquinone] cytochrome b small subunit, mitochondrial isoform X1 n=1 Tax=Eurytemora carolleeae TaxID=1294199 RepID=UPI000C78A8C2|nr:succinate dehydrogenase [ubiquinone] cytochrome b small subunit, mitochondrial isoform X1 [Eurytemora carolleeae]|eukprot:XP_023345192.1 succinate dehydrogenase [ubiquinone] cytochrome b small subunit, mitochondrial-like isoform X1 [Eurytemora affinis]